MLHLDTEISASAAPAGRPEPNASWGNSFSARLGVWFFICLNSPRGFEALA